MCVCGCACVCVYGCERMTIGWEKSSPREENGERVFFFVLIRIEIANNYVNNAKKTFACWS